MTDNPGFFSLRPAIEKDSEVLTELEKTVYKTAWTHAMIQEVLADAQSLVLIACNASDRLLGASLGRCAADEFELYKLSVYPDFRRCGLGHALLKASLQEAHKRGATRVFLEVRQSNQPARALYGSLGFSVLSTRAHYYDDTGEDALLMGRALPLENKLQ
jgi:[ribosomal protein S18]-alanine N-acetyltransferase